MRPGQACFRKLVSITNDHPDGLNVLAAISATGAGKMAHSIRPRLKTERKDPIPGYPIRVLFGFFLLFI